jgi:hypothetical protein
MALIPFAHPAQIAFPVSGREKVDPGSLLAEGAAMEVPFDAFYRPDRCLTEWFRPQAHPITF